MEQLKQCSRCKEIKPMSEFYKRLSRKSGLMSHCKDCNKKKVSEWYRQNLEYCKEHYKEYYEINKTKILERSKKYHQQNLKYCKERNRKYYKINKTKIQKQKCEYNRIYQREKRQKNPQFRLNNNMAVAIWRALKDNKADRCWENLVEYTINDLEQHLESLFVKGMSWDNYGKWHIDHKIPISAFNFDKPEHLDFKKCWALNNLQPLWARDNISKSNNLNKSFQPSLKL